MPAQLSIRQGDAISRLRLHDHHRLGGVGRDELLELALIQRIPDKLAVRSCRQQLILRHSEHPLPLAFFRYTLNRHSERDHDEPPSSSSDCTVTGGSPVCVSLAGSKPGSSAAADGSTPAPPAAPGAGLRPSPGRAVRRRSRPPRTAAHPPAPARARSRWRPLSGGSFESPPGPSATPTAAR